MPGLTLETVPKRGFRLDEVAEHYPDLAVEHLYADADADAQALVLRPQHFDVIVMENLLGDILSDLGGATIGGIGLCGSGNVGDAHAYFEPVHGSAPDIVGHDIANPIGQILSAALMLDHLKEGQAAGVVRSALGQALDSGAIAIDSAGRPHQGTRAVSEVLSSLISAP